jgi:hypothetical protein
MRRGAFIPPYLVALLGAAACRTPAVGSPPSPPPPVASPLAPSPAATPPPSTAAPPLMPAAPAATPAAGPEGPVSFEASVKPLLARTCTPCHVPGGRMYERLPFDHADVVLAHKDGILRRLKNPDDHQLLERWLASQPKG